jgi:hypothetical protein
MNDFYLFLVFALSALDACRDGFRADLYNGISNRGWHVIKHLSWTPLMFLLWWQIDGLFPMILGAFLGLIGWRFGLLFTPVRWKSVWFKYAIILFNKFIGLFKKTT